MTTRPRPSLVGINVALMTALFVASLGAVQKPRPPARGPHILEPDRGWVRKTMKSLSLRDRVAQLVKVRVAGRFLNRNSPEFRDLADQIQKQHVGGVVLFAGNIYESAQLLNDLQLLSKLPLLVSADFERGAAFRITDSTSFPWTMAVGAAGSEELAYRQGVVTARESRALGVHWIFAPVMDVNNNPDNPVINIRSFGEDPRLVAKLGTAFIRGARENGVLTTAKHFPGHGDTATDSHIGLAVVTSDRSRLDAVELVPFRSAIEAGVDSIMSAHVAVPQVTGEPDVPGTLSPKVLTGLLRDDLHFQGLVVTDAMEMGGITTKYWTGLAAIRAIQAGTDMLLLPPDADVAINEVVRAVQRGDIREERINQSVERVLLAKTRLGLHRDRLVPLSRVSEVVASPENQRLAQEIADRSITLARDDAHALPLSPLVDRRLLSIVLSADVDSSPAAVFQSELRRRYTSVRTVAVDPRTPSENIGAIENAAADSDFIVCTTVVRVISGSGTVGLPDRHRSLLEKLAATGKPIVWVAMGNPYVLRALPQARTYLCTFSYSDTSQIAAARAMSGEIEIAGRMPVTIPGLLAVGSGVSVPRLSMTLTSASLESVGLPASSFERATRLLESYAQSRAYPGAALVVGYRGRTVLDTAVGHLDYSGNSPAVTGDTIYDLASVSKAIGTTSAAMMLVDSGKLLLDARVQDYLPEFQGPMKEKVLVRHLLSHSAGFPAFLPLYKDAKGYEAVLKQIYAIPLEGEPGFRTKYSDLGMILMGEIVARASGQSLDAFVSNHLIQPLGLKSTMYRPPASFLRRIAPTENDPWRKRVVRGEVHDENAYAMGGVAGHAGLFSSAHDLAVVAQMLLNKGLYDHRRYVSAATLARFATTQGSTDSGRGIGWSKPSPASWTGATFSAMSFGHTGFTGTLVWIDPERDLFIVLLSNRVHPSRENARFDEARQSISEAVVKAIADASAKATQ